MLQVYSKELGKLFLVVIHNHSTSLTVHLCTFLKYKEEENTLWNATAGKVTLYRKHQHSWLLSFGRNSMMAFLIH